MAIETPFFEHVPDLIRVELCTVAVLAVVEGFILGSILFVIISSFL